MEKRISPLKKKRTTGFPVRVVLGVFAICTFSLYAQNTRSSELLRFSLWFPVDNVPVLQGLPEKGEKVYERAVAEIKVLTPFMLEGLVYGWRFTYTPSDTLRAVEEFFDVDPLVAVSSDDGRLSYTDARFVPESNRLECWVEYKLDESMIRKRERWHSSTYPKITGTGSSSILNGSEGIKEACRQALKNAVRNYARSLVKNKPKEISGTVLLTDLPRYYIKSGKYCADLDFFLFVSKMEEYTRF